ADLSHGQWLGLFSPSHLPYVDDRDTQTPGLLDMTQAAVQRLSHNEEGYVLVIEAGRIDHAHHEGNGYRALKETEELHQTVDWLLQSVD
ncbi:alkaline phosphatase, partial [Wenyingzhuangia sp. 1_MG-2023]|nr:alkaline phosphatase [Wenyingzhuangia sp. 1_MG-2023]